ncbi:hypothetical protein LguiA_026666 [Lonicera macranthoides]
MERELEKVYVETDSEILAAAFNKAEIDSSVVGLIIQDCVSLQRDIDRCNFCFARRSTNRVSHLLARVALSKSGQECWDRKILKCLGFQKVAQAFQIFNLLTTITTVVLCCSLSPSLGSTSKTLTGECHTENPPPPFQVTCELMRRSCDVEVKVIVHGISIQNYPDKFCKEVAFFEEDSTLDKQSVPQEDDNLFYLKARKTLKELIFIMQKAAPFTSPQTTHV